jgi:predicted nucleic acid-binding protein
VTRYYLDTSIWRDLHENRTDRFRPLGEWAFELIRKIREERHIILYSDAVVDELTKYFEKVDKIFGLAMEANILLKVDITKEQITEAVNLRKKLQIPHKDCLHAILARDNDAILVTRDRDFEKINFVMIKKPEELI